MAGRSPKSVPAFAQTRMSPHPSALDASSISLKTVFDRMGGYIAILSTDGTVIDINTAPLTASGFHRDDVVGHRYWETPFWRGHPKEQEAVRISIMDAAEGHASQGEWTYYTADGSERFAARYVTPIHDDRRNVHMIVAEGLDITDRVHAERNLLESQQRLYRLVHHVPEAIVMLDCDSGHFMDANEAAQSLFGRSREEMKQIGPIDLSPPTQPNGRDTRDYAREMIDLALSGETPEFEWLHRNGNGNEITCIVRLVQLPWTGQKILCGNVVDITKRKRLEAIERGRNLVLEKLARGASLEEVLTILVETIETQFSGMLCSVLTLDHATNRLHVGAAPNLPKFYNRAVEGVQIGPKVGSCGAAAYLGEQVVVSDVRCHENWAPHVKLAEKANVRACWSEPIISSGNRVLGTFAMYYSEVREPSPAELDAITSAAQLAAIAIERRRADQKLAAMNRELEQRVRTRTADLEQVNRDLRRSNRDLEQFAYAASHDLREPLRALTGFADLLQMRYRQNLDDRAGEYLEHISEGAARMHELLDGLLAYSRLGAEEKAFEILESELTLDAAIANLSASMKRSHAIIHRGPLPRVVADFAQLVQLFQNLIGNAIKFRGKQIPEITVSALRADQFWQFRVRDNGIGIDPSYCQQVFEIFHRLHTREEYPGLGIGLALCKRIVDRHDGDIWVELNPGGGSTFTFTLPAASDS